MICNLRYATYARDVKYKNEADTTDVANAVEPFQVTTLDYVIA